MCQCLVSWRWWGSATFLSSVIKHPPVLHVWGPFADRRHEDRNKEGFVPWQWAEWNTGLVWAVWLAPLFHQSFHCCLEAIRVCFNFRTLDKNTVIFYWSLRRGLKLSKQYLKSAWQMAKKKKKSKYFQSSSERKPLVRLHVSNQLQQIFFFFFYAWELI